MYTPHTHYGNFLQYPQFGNCSLFSFSSTLQSNYFSERENWKPIACPSHLRKWWRRYGISAMAVEHKLCTAKKQRYSDRYCGSFHDWDTCSWESYWNSIFKSHLGSTTIIQLWVWILLCWTQTTAMGWSPLKSSNSFSIDTVTQNCFHFSISWISIIYFHSVPPAFPTHLPAEERNPQPHPEFIITTPALCQSSLRTPNKPLSMGLQPLRNFVLLFSMPGISQTV